MKLNTKYGLKRIGAYILDMILVEMIIYGLFSIDALNPNKQAYLDTYAKYQEQYQKYTNKELSDQDYKYIYMEYNYQLSKLDVSYALINIGVISLYFGLFEYLNKGKTLGKRILGLKVESSHKKKLHLYNFLIRALLVNSLAVMIIKLISLMLFNEIIYYYVCYYFSQIDNILQLLIVCMIFLDEKGIAIHDKLSWTKVVDLKSKKQLEEKTENEVIVDEDEKLKSIVPIEKEAK